MRFIEALEISSGAGAKWYWRGSQVALVYRWRWSQAALAWEPGGTDVQVALGPGGTGVGARWR